MSSHPNPASPKAQVQLDLGEADTITCEPLSNKALNV